MSLVNDMLRDLDSRRRDAPATGVGAERLIPATESGRRQNSSVNWPRIVLAGLVLAGIVLIGWLLWPGLQTQTSRAIDIPLQAQAPAPAASVEDDGMTAELLEELNRVTERMNALEAQNQALRNEAQPQETQPQETQPPAVTQDWSPRSWEGSAQENSTPQVVSSPTVTAARPVEEKPVVIQQEEPVTSGTLTRSPRDLSFRENDRQLVQQALQSWQQGQRSVALTQLREFIADNPEAHQSREMLAKLLLQQGDTIAAMQVTDAGLQISPEHGGFKKIKARLMMTAGVPADAVELLALRAPTVAADNEYHELLAAARLAAQDYEDALLTYQALTTVRQNESRYWYGVASSLDALGRNYEAQQAYERALQLGNLSAGLVQATQQRLLALRQN